VRRTHQLGPLNCTRRRIRRAKIYRSRATSYSRAANSSSRRGSVIASLCRCARDDVSPSRQPRLGLAEHFGLLALADDALLRVPESQLDTDIPTYDRARQLHGDGSDYASCRGSSKRWYARDIALRNGIVIKGAPASRRTPALGCSPSERGFTRDYPTG
jgi:hypothetical protein